MSVNSIAHLITSVESEPFVTAMFGALLLVVSAGLRRFQTPGTPEDVNRSGTNEDMALGSGKNVRPQFPPRIVANTIHPGRLD